MTPHLLRALAAVGQRAQSAIDAARPSSVKPPIKIGLIGAGIDASRSPVMHVGEGRRLGIPYAYELIDSDRLGFGQSDLAAILDWAEGEGFTGLNVTHPFKQRVQPFLDDIADEADAIGAINTIVFRNGKRLAFNTDSTGFADSFRRDLSGAPLRRIAQIGAGGAGAAVAYALAKLGAGRIALYDTDTSKARELANRLAPRSGSASIVAAASAEQAIEDADGVVNATPIGMTKYPGLPLARALLHAGLWVADVVYFPRHTELLAVAQSLGCRVLPGIGMAVFQAVHAFKHFTGVDADPANMLRLLNRDD